MEVIKNIHRYLEQQNNHKMTVILRSIIGHHYSLLLVGRRRKKYLEGFKLSINQIEFGFDDLTVSDQNLKDWKKINFT